MFPSGNACTPLPTTLHHGCRSGHPRSPSRRHPRAIEHAVMSTRPNPKFHETTSCSRIRVGPGRVAPRVGAAPRAERDVHEPFLHRDARVVRAACGHLSGQGSVRGDQSTGRLRGGRREVVSRPPSPITHAAGGPGGRFRADAEARLAQRGRERRNRTMTRVGIPGSRACWKMKSPPFAGRRFLVQFETRSHDLPRALLLSLNP